MYYRKLVVGSDTLTNFINFDNAATTPPFKSVLRAINSLSPWYSSIHRGNGVKSIFSSEIYEDARNKVLDFVGGDYDKDTVIFLKNTTEAINKLSYRLFNENRKDIIVLCSEMEHHSNMLPWRTKYTVDYINVDENGRLDLNDLEDKLKMYEGKVKLVAVTGASNVTGYINPIYSIATLVHKYGAKILVDGAQFIPHNPFTMKSYSSSDHIDFLAFSAHKMYAPFGCGVLIGPKSVFEKNDPEYTGGGTVRIVTKDEIIWDNPPYKEEAGTPNLMGVAALSESIDTLKKIGMENIQIYEEILLNYALFKLKTINRIVLYCSDIGQADQQGIIPFNIEGLHHERTAELLSKEGIAVRSGCFCAQPYVQKLLNIPTEEMQKYIMDPSLTRPGMVRISFGIYNEFWEIDKLINVLKKICNKI